MNVFYPVLSIFYRISLIWMPLPLSPHPAANAALCLGLGLDPSVMLRSRTYIGASLMRESSSVVNGMERIVRTWAVLLRL